MILSVLENFVLNSRGAVRNSFLLPFGHDAITETWGKISWVMKFEGVNYFLNLFIKFGIITMEVETREKFNNIFLEKACKLLQD